MAHSHPVLSPVIMYEVIIMLVVCVELMIITITLFLLVTYIQILMAMIMSEVFVAV